MRVLLVMIRVQFKIFLRNRVLLVASLGIATISMFVFGFLFGDNSSRPLAIGVSDLDKSQTSAQVISAMKKSSDLQVSEGSQSTLLDQLKNGHLSALVVLQSGFGNGLAQGNAQAQLYIDHSDMIGSARSQGSINGIFDAISKQAVGYKNLIHVQEEQVTVQPLRQIDSLTPGMLGLTIMYANIYAGMVLTSWRLNGTLKRLSATPLKAWQLICAQILSQFLSSLAQAAIVLLIAVAVFKVHVDPATLPNLAIFVLAGSFCIIGLGYAVGNFVPKPNAAQAVATLIALPMMFLGGSYFPVNATGIMQVIVEITPLTHLNRAFHQIMLNNAGWNVLLPEMGILLLIGAVLLTISVRTFRWNW